MEIALWKIIRVPWTSWMNFFVPDVYKIAKNSKE